MNSLIEAGATKVQGFIQVARTFELGSFLDVLRGILRESFGLVRNVPASTVTYRVIMEDTYLDFIYRMLLK